MAVERKISWVLLDLDNTLVASNPFLLKVCFLWFYFRECRKINLNFYAALKILKIMKRALYFQEGQLCNVDRVAASLQGKLSVESLQELMTAVFLAMENQFHPLPEARQIVAQLRSRYKLALATNPVWPLAATAMRLKLLELSPEDFQFVTHNQNMKFVKPDPRYYAELLEKLGASAENCLMIGDNEVKDGPARQVGIETLIIDKRRSLLQQLSGVLNE